MDYNRRVLPFYMAYPNFNVGMPYLNAQEEDTVMRDLDYLQQIYPEDAKKYQARISSILDKMDYEGSMIYDEYPDKNQLYSLAENIIIILKREAQEDAFKKGMEVPPFSEEKWKWTQDFVQVLLFYEIYRRRHRPRQGFLKF